MLINGKKEAITHGDMIACGRNMDISTPRCNRIITDVVDAVEKWPIFASQNGIREKTADQINQKLIIAKNSMGV